VSTINGILYLLSSFTTPTFLPEWGFKSPKKIRLNAGYAGQNQQKMGKAQPSQVEMSNLFSALLALGGEMPPPSH
jgi:hypothetical protein